jgi:uncharacterized protein
MQSAFYFGKLRHRRFRPKAHQFTYDLFMAWLDIDRIPELTGISRLLSYNRFNWASFHQRDHFGDAGLPLRERLTRDAKAQGISLPGGPIYLLTHLRYLGYNFNPISFFYCYEADHSLRMILAEVNSTFGETHNYWLHAGNEESGNIARHYQCPKALHVSPFMGMNLDYKFVLTAPGDELVAHMNTLEAGESFFDATLTLHRAPWSARSLHRALLSHPWMTAKVIAAIHWQALRLYFKKVPVFTHPGRLTKEAPK